MALFHLDAPSVAHLASWLWLWLAGAEVLLLLRWNVVEETSSGASVGGILPEGALILGSSSSCDVLTHVTVKSSRIADAPVYTAADIVTSSRGKILVVPTSDVGGSSQSETSEESADSFFELAVLISEDAGVGYIPRMDITTTPVDVWFFSCRTLVDRVTPPGFFSTLRNMDYDQLFEEFNVGAARQICLGEKDAEIARLKSLVKEKETESAEVLRLRDQVSVLAADKSLLSAEVSALKSAVSQKDTDISLLDSRASYLKSALDDSQAACGEARNLISSLSSERDGLASEVSTLHSAFRDFKEKMEAQQEAQAQELYNRVAKLEAHVMDVSGRMEGEFYPAYLTALAGRRWLLTHGMELAYVFNFFLEVLHLYVCLEQLLSLSIMRCNDVCRGETSLSFALLNVHTRVEGAKKHAAALRQLMVDIVSHPLSSQNLLGEASTSAVISCVEDLDTDEYLGSVVCMPQLEDPRYLAQWPNGLSTESDKVSGGRNHLIPYLFAEFYEAMFIQDYLEDAPRQYIPYDYNVPPMSTSNGIGPLRSPSVLRLRVERTLPSPERSFG
ncbi:hypothetical protein Tco_1304857 [Tanacetum coccineum]